MIVTKLVEVYVGVPKIQPTLVIDYPVQSHRLAKNVRPSLVIRITA
jgi:hypothetical protein